MKAVRPLGQHGREAFPGSGHQTPLEEENRRLKRELERVQQERDILKRGMLLRSTTGNEQGYTVDERRQRENGVFA
jgi:transposase